MDGLKRLYLRIPPHQPLIIEDLLEDERTKPIVSLPDYPPFHFYDRLLLSISKGFSTGMLSAMDGDSKTLKYNQIEDLGLGDAYMCVGGFSEESNSHAKRVYEATLDILQFMEDLILKYEVPGNEH